MTRPRFLADHDLNEHIITGVARLNPGLEFVRVREVGLATASDRDVLAYAASLSFCVVSHDVNTMTATAGAMIKAGVPFSGVFLVRQTTPVQVAIESIALVWSASNGDEWRNQVVFLPF